MTFLPPPSSFFLVVILTLPRHLRAKTRGPITLNVKPHIISLDTRIYKSYIWLFTRNSMYVMQSFIYILASRKYGTLYIGVTSDLIKRVYQHKNHFIKGFTAKYKIYNLVYYEIFEDIWYAIQREKNLKRWNRSWKIKLINDNNPEWRDLYGDII